MSLDGVLHKAHGSGACQLVNPYQCPLSPGTAIIRMHGINRQISGRPPLTRHGHEVADEVARVAAQGTEVGGAAAALGVGAKGWEGITHRGDAGCEVMGSWQQVHRSRWCGRHAV